MNDPDQKSDKQPNESNSAPTASFADVVGGPGDQVGSYKLLGVLGEGGFAVVYLAEHQGPVKRRVALKVIKPGMDTKQVIARFEAERLRMRLIRLLRGVQGNEYEPDIALAHTYYHLGRYSKAEALYDQIIEPFQRKYGTDWVLFRPVEACHLGRVYAAQARYTEAEQLFLGAFKTSDPEWDTESRWRHIYQRDLANMYTEQGLFGQAEQLLVQTLASQRQLLGDKHAWTWKPWAALPGSIQLRGAMSKPRFCSKRRC